MKPLKYFISKFVQGPSFSLKWGSPNIFNQVSLVKRNRGWSDINQVPFYTLSHVRGLSSNTGGKSNLRQQPEYNFAPQNNTSTTMSLDSQATSIINSYFYSINNSPAFFTPSDYSDTVGNGSSYIENSTSKENQDISHIANDNFSEIINPSGFLSVIRKSAQKKNIFISKLSFNHSNSKHIVTIKFFYYISSINIASHGHTTEKPANESANISSGFSSGGQVNSRISPKTSNVITEISFRENSDINTIRDILGKLYNKEVSLVITRVYYPYMNSYILGQYLAHNAKTNTFVRFQGDIFAKAKKALDNNSELHSPNLNFISQPIFSLYNSHVGVEIDSISNSSGKIENNSTRASSRDYSRASNLGFVSVSPSYDITTSKINKEINARITGIKVQLSGRLTTEHVVPRITVKSKVLGSFQTEINNSQQVNVNLKNTTYPSNYVRDASMTHQVNGNAVSKIRDNFMVQKGDQHFAENACVVYGNNKKMVTNIIHINKVVKRSPEFHSNFPMAEIQNTGINPIFSTVGKSKMKNASYIEYAKVTTKNRLGSFTIKVWIASRRDDSLFSL